MLTAILIMSGLALAIGIVLGFAAVKFKTEENPLVDKIDAILPQTQCGQCGFPGCYPYAEAISRGEADINRCSPGGREGLHQLADLLGIDVNSLGDNQLQTKVKAVAIIDEQRCIGCTLCVQACPVDAIIGAAKQIHTVISEQCTGCELCVAACPVNCIEMKALTEDITQWKWKYPRFDIKNITRRTHK